jgi:hypothetical protein
MELEIQWGQQNSSLLSWRFVPLFSQCQLLFIIRLPQHD